jgi:hypothetical protein
MSCMRLYREHLSHCYWREASFLVGGASQLGTVLYFRKERQRKGKE